MGDLNEGQKISYEVIADRRTGKSPADISSRRDGAFLYLDFCLIGTTSAARR